MKRSAYILSVIFSLLMLPSCLKLLERDRVVASVGKTSLHMSQIEDLFPAGISAFDSLELLNDYVDDWTRRQVKLLEAENMLRDSTAGIERMVNDYRSSLFTYRLDQMYVNARLDTMITDSMVAAYFHDHRSDFVLDRTLVKGRLVRVPESYRQSLKLLNMMRSSKEEQQKNFNDTCEKNDFELHVFDSWIDFNDFLSYLPVRRNRDYSYMLSKSEVQEMADSDNKYFVQITDCLQLGADAPYDRVSDLVRRIIYNQRRNEVIKNYEDSLYNAALNNDMVKINIVE